MKYLTANYDKPVMYQLRMRYCVAIIFILPTFVTSSTVTPRPPYVVILNFSDWAISTKVSSVCLTGWVQIHREISCHLYLVKR